MAGGVRPHKIRVNSVNPGNVDTDMNRPESYATGRTGISRQGVSIYFRQNANWSRVDANG
ncbi:D-erythrulose reductase [Orchesella cincta]|uniref:D-erythrulose reductase n=1 Tax=Orchesella cincta TaxID=48709 RepID=A0A1D2M2D0_ORCCI|nr:D-erythrulose reductase [Orchesella cincta]